MDAFSCFQYVVYGKKREERISYKSPEAVQRHREAYQAMSKAEQLYNKADDDHMASLRAAAGQKK